MFNDDSGQKPRLKIIISRWDWERNEMRFEDTVYLPHTMIPKKPMNRERSDIRKSNGSKDKQVG